MRPSNGGKSNIIKACLHILNSSLEFRTVACRVTSNAGGEEIAVVTRDNQMGLLGENLHPVTVTLTEGGLCTLAVLFRPVQSFTLYEYASSDIRQLKDLLLRLAASNVYVFCPGLLPDQAKMCGKDKRLVQHQHPFRRYQAADCPVWYKRSPDSKVEAALQMCPFCRLLINQASQKNASSSTDKPSPSVDLSGPPERRRESHTSLAHSAVARALASPPLSQPVRTSSAGSSSTEPSHALQGQSASPHTTSTSGEGAAASVPSSRAPLPDAGSSVQSAGGHPARPAPKGPGIPCSSGAVSSCSGRGEQRRASSGESQAGHGQMFPSTSSSSSSTTLYGAATTSSACTSMVALGQGDPGIPPAGTAVPPRTSALPPHSRPLPSMAAGTACSQGVSQEVRSALAERVRSGCPGLVRDPTSPSEGPSSVIHWPPHSRQDLPPPPPHSVGTSVPHTLNEEPPPSMLPSDDILRRETDAPLDLSRVRRRHSDQGTSKSSLQGDPIVLPSRNPEAWTAGDSIERQFETSGTFASAFVSLEASSSLTDAGSAGCGPQTVTSAVPSAQTLLTVAQPASSGPAAAAAQRSVVLPGPMQEPVHWRTAHDAAAAGPRTAAHFVTWTRTSTSDSVLSTQAPARQVPPVPSSRVQLPSPTDPDSGPGGPSLKMVPPSSLVNQINAFVDRKQTRRDSLGFSISQISDPVTVVSTNSYPIGACLPASAARNFGAIQTSSDVASRPENSAVRCAAAQGSSRSALVEILSRSQQPPTSVHARDALYSQADASRTQQFPAQSLRLPVVTSEHPAHCSLEARWEASSTSAAVGAQLPSRDRNLPFRLPMKKRRPDMQEQQQAGGAPGMPPVTSTVRHDYIAFPMAPPPPPPPSPPLSPDPSMDPRYDQFRIKKPQKSIPVGSLPESVVSLMGGQPESALRLRLQLPVSAPAPGPGRQPQALSRPPPPAAAPILATNGASECWLVPVTTFPASGAGPRPLLVSTAAGAAPVGGNGVIRLSFPVSQDPPVMTFFPPAPTADDVKAAAPKKGRNQGSAPRKPRQPKKKKTSASPPPAGAQDSLLPVSSDAGNLASTTSSATTATATATATTTTLSAASSSPQQSSALPASGSQDTPAATTATTASKSVKEARRSRKSSKSRKGAGDTSASSMNGEPASTSTSTSSDLPDAQVPKSATPPHAAPGAAVSTEPTPEPAGAAPKKGSSKKETRKRKKAGTKPVVPPLPKDGKDSAPEQAAPGEGGGTRTASADPPPAEEEKQKKSSGSLKLTLKLKPSKSSGSKAAAKRKGKAETPGQEMAEAAGEQASSSTAPQAVPPFKIVVPPKSTARSGSKKRKSKKKKIKKNRVVKPLGLSHVQAVASITRRKTREKLAVLRLRDGTTINGFSPSGLAGPGDKQPEEEGEDSVARRVTSRARRTRNGGPGLSTFKNDARGENGDSELWYENAASENLDAWIVTDAPEGVTIHVPEVDSAQPQDQPNNSLFNMLIDAASSAFNELQAENPQTPPTSSNDDSSKSDAVESPPATNAETAKGASDCGAGGSSVLESAEETRLTSKAVGEEIPPSCKLPISDRPDKSATAYVSVDASAMTSAPCVPAQEKSASELPTARDSDVTPLVAPDSVSSVSHGEEQAAASAETKKERDQKGVAAGDSSTEQPVEEPRENASQTSEETVLEMGRVRETVHRGNVASSEIRNASRKGNDLLDMEDLPANRLKLSMLQLASMDDMANRPLQDEEEQDDDDDDSRLRIDEREFAQEENEEQNIPQISSDLQGFLWSCSRCGAEYRSRDLLQHHMKIHTAWKPFYCTVCCKTFPTSDVLKAHVDNHPGVKPHLCTICYRVFRKLTHLESHQRLHVRPPRRVSCPVCSMTFQKASSLHMHMGSHNEEFKDVKQKKPIDTGGYEPTLMQRAAVDGGSPIRFYACPHCRKPFKTKYWCEKHMGPCLQKRREREQRKAKRAARGSNISGGAKRSRRTKRNGTPKSSSVRGDLDAAVSSTPKPAAVVPPAEKENAPQDAREGDGILTPGLSSLHEEAGEHAMRQDTDALEDGGESDPENPGTPSTVAYLITPPCSPDSEPYHGLWDDVPFAQDTGPSEVKVEPADRADWGEEDTVLTLSLNPAESAACSDDTLLAFAAPLDLPVLTSPSRPHVRRSAGLKFTRVASSLAQQPEKSGKCVKVQGSAEAVAQSESSNDKAPSTLPSEADEEEVGVEEEEDVDITSASGEDGMQPVITEVKSVPESEFQNGLSSDELASFPEAADDAGELDPAPGARDASEFTEDSLITLNPDVDLDQESEQTDQEREDEDTEREEVDKEREEVDTEREEVDREREEVDREREEVDQEREEVDREREEVDTEREEVDTEREEVDMEREEVDMEREEVDTEREEVDTEREEVDQEREEVDTEREEVDQEREEVDQEREEVDTEREEVDQEDEQPDRERDEVEQESQQMDQEGEQTMQEGERVDLEREQVDQEDEQLDQERAEIEQEREELDQESEQTDQEREQVDQEMMPAAETSSTGFASPAYEAPEDATALSSPDQPPVSGARESSAASLAPPLPETVSGEAPQSRGSAGGAGPARSRGFSLPLTPAKSRASSRPDASTASPGDLRQLVVPTAAPAGGGGRDRAGATAQLGGADSPPPLLDPLEPLDGERPSRGDGADTPLPPVLTRFDQNTPRKKSPAKHPETCRAGPAFAGFPEGPFRALRLTRPDRPATASSGDHPANASMASSTSSGAALGADSRQPPRPGMTLPIIIHDKYDPSVEKRRLASTASSVVCRRDVVFSKRGTHFQSRRRRESSSSTDSAEFSPDAARGCEETSGRFENLLDASAAETSEQGSLPDLEYDVAAGSEGEDEGEGEGEEDDSVVIEVDIAGDLQEKDAGAAEDVGMDAQEDGDEEEESRDGASAVGRGKTPKIVEGVNASSKSKRNPGEVGHAERSTERHRPSGERTRIGSSKATASPPTAAKPKTNRSPSKTRPRRLAPDDVPQPSPRAPSPQREPSPLPLLKAPRRMRRMSPSKRRQASESVEKSLAAKVNICERVKQRPRPRKNLCEKTLFREMSAWSVPAYKRSTYRGRRLSLGGPSQKVHRSPLGSAQFRKRRGAGKTPLRRRASLASLSPHQRGRSPRATRAAALGDRGSEDGRSGAANKSSSAGFFSRKTDSTRGQPTKAASSRDLRKPEAERGRHTLRRDGPPQPSDPGGRSRSSSSQRRREGPSKGQGPTLHAAKLPHRSASPRVLVKRLTSIEVSSASSRKERTDGDATAPASSLPVENGCDDTAESSGDTDDDATVDLAPSPRPLNRTQEDDDDVDEDREDEPHGENGAQRTCDGAKDPAGENSNQGQSASSGPDVQRTKFTVPKVVTPSSNQNTKKITFPDSSRIKSLLKELVVCIPRVDDDFVKRTSKLNPGNVPRIGEKAALDCARESTASVQKHDNEAKAKRIENLDTPKCAKELNTVAEANGTNKSNNSENSENQKQYVAEVSLTASNSETDESIPKVSVSAAATEKEDGEKKKEEEEEEDCDDDDDVVRPTPAKRRKLSDENVGTPDETSSATLGAPEALEDPEEGAVTPQEQVAPPSDENVEESPAFQSPDPPPPESLPQGEDEDDDMEIFPEMFSSDTVKQPRPRSLARRKHSYRRYALHSPQRGVSSPRKDERDSSSAEVSFPSLSADVYAFSEEAVDHKNPAGMHAVTAGTSRPGVASPMKKWLSNVRASHLPSQLIERGLNVIRVHRAHSAEESGHAHPHDEERSATAAGGERVVVCLQRARGATGASRSRTTCGERTAEPKSAPAALQSAASGNASSVARPAAAATATATAPEGAPGKVSRPQVQGPSGATAAQQYCNKGALVTTGTVQLEARGLVPAKRKQEGPPFQAGGKRFRTAVGVASSSSPDDASGKSLQGRSRAETGGQRQVSFLSRKEASKLSLPAPDTAAQLNRSDGVPPSLGTKPAAAVSSKTRSPSIDLLAPTAKTTVLRHPAETARAEPAASEQTRPGSVMVTLRNAAVQASIAPPPAPPTPPKSEARDSDRTRESQPQVLQRLRAPLRSDRRSESPRSSRSSSTESLPRWQTSHGGPREDAAGRNPGRNLGSAERRTRSRSPRASSVDSDTPPSKPPSTTSSTRPAIAVRKTWYMRSRSPSRSAATPRSSLGRARGVSSDREPSPAANTAKSRSSTARDADSAARSGRERGERKKQEVSGFPGNGQTSARDHQHPRPAERRDQPGDSHAGKGAASGLPPNSAADAGAAATPSPPAVHLPASASTESTKLKSAYVSLVSIDTQPRNGASRNRTEDRNVFSVFQQPSSFH